MKKCLVCKNEFEEKADLCKTCYSFFEWKYGTKVDEKIKELRKHFHETDTQLNARRYKK